MRVAPTILFTVAVAAHLRAHERDVSLLGAVAMSPWDAGALVMLLAGGLLYAVGLARLSRRGAHMRPIERASFWTGWSVLVASVAPPIDGAASLRFSAHMVQHELMMLIGAPLMIVGRPIVPWLWALPRRWRPSAGAGLQWRPLALGWTWATTPVIAWALHGLAIWLWHLPAFYEAAVASEAVHAVQHATFVGTSVVFWWGLVYGRYGRAAYGASVLYVFTTMVHTGILGALFALSTAPFYGVYRDRAAAAGVDPAVDQQLAGLLMWVPAGLVLTISGLALLLAWMSEADRRTRAAGRATSLLLVAASAGLLAISCTSMPHEQEARRLTGGDPHRGRARITRYGCDTCHTIPGVPTADATVGPPLTGVARRVYLAGRIENTPENMRRWIEHPHQVDDRTAMPEMGVGPEDSRDITAYLYTLR